jgi:hypothetical protein
MLMFGGRRASVDEAVLAELRAIRSEMQGIREDLSTNYVRKDEWNAAQQQSRVRITDRQWTLNWALTVGMYVLYLLNALNIHVRLVP